MAWSTRLRNASFRGVAFECTSISDEGGRTLVLSEYAGRDGAKVDDTGGRPRKGRMSAVFLGESYEDELAALLAVFALSGSDELVHPVFGTFRAAIETWSVTHSVEGRDEAQLEFNWVEDTLDAGGFEVVTDSPAAKESALNLALGRTESLALAHPNSPSFISQVRAFTAKVRTFTDRARNPNIGVIRTATQVLAEVQTMGQDVLDAVRTVQNPDNQPLVRQVKRTLVLGNELNRLVATEAPPWVSYEVHRWTSARLIASDLYGDSDRAAEIVQANALRDPGRIGPGTILQVRAS